MITTSTGAKKIENTDNWREIFDAHNDSVDAEDKLAQDTAPIVNGNKSTTGASAGEYVLVRNSSITGITDGAYKAAQAIPANTAIDSTYLTAITGGIANDLNSKFTPVGVSITLNTTDWSNNATKCYIIDKLVIVNIYAQGTPTNNKTIATGLPIPESAILSTAGSPPSVIAVNTNGVLYVSSAGTGAYLGGCIAYMTN